MQEIRSLMERSSRFTSLSGFSGIIVGLLALVGLGVVYGILNQQYVSYSAVCQGQLPAATGPLLMLTAWLSTTSDVFWPINRPSLTRSTVSHSLVSPLRITSGLYS